MKKILCILLISGYCISLSAQQKEFKYEYYIGVKGGITLTQVRFYPNVQTSFMQGNTGGLIFRMISEPHIGFQIEFNYIEKGWKEKPFTGEFASTSYFHRLNYLDLPIMTHVSLGKKAMRFTLNLGPEFSFLMSDSQGFKPNAVIPSDTDGYNPYYFQPIDTSLDILFTGGLAMEYHFRKGSALTLEGRVFYSLPNLYDTKKYIYKASQSNGLEVTLAYLFRLDKTKNKSKL
jgi:hypothetical protein